jgi:hypothetical protein
MHNARQFSHLDDDTDVYIDVYMPGRRRNSGMHVVYTFTAFYNELDSVTMSAGMICPCKRDCARLEGVQFGRRGYCTAFMMSLANYFKRPSFRGLRVSVSSSLDFVIITSHAERNPYI